MSTHRKSNFVGRLATLFFVAFLGFALTYTLMHNRADVPLGTTTDPTSSPSETLSDFPPPLEVPEPTTAVDLAKAIKPLMLLEKGDRVLLWRPNTDKPRYCIWENWSGDIDFSNIRCKDDGLQINVHTAYLTPIESRIPQGKP